MELCGGSRYYKSPWSISVGDIENGIKVIPVKLSIERDREAC